MSYQTPEVAAVASYYNQSHFRAAPSCGASRQGYGLVPACRFAAYRGPRSSIQLIESLGEERTIVVAAQLDPRLDTPKPEDLHKVGTLATVHKVVRMPNQSRFVFTEGVSRVRLVRYTQTEPFMIAEVETLEDIRTR